MNDNAKEILAAVIAWLVLIALTLLIVFGMFFGWQKAKVYAAESTGRAELAKAQQNRQIAALDAEAEIARARGVAEANAIIADGLGGPDGYLRYLQIDAMKNLHGTVVYVPTEAGIPITESQRLREKE